MSPAPRLFLAFFDLLRFCLPSCSTRFPFKKHPPNPNSVWRAAGWPPLRMGRKDGGRSSILKERGWVPGVHRCSPRRESGAGRGGSSRGRSFSWNPIRFPHPEKGPTGWSWGHHPSLKRGWGRRFPGQKVGRDGQPRTGKQAEYLGFAVSGRVKGAQSLNEDRNPMARAFSLTQCQAHKGA